MPETMCVFETVRERKKRLLCANNRIKADGKEQMMLNSIGDQKYKNKHESWKLINLHSLSLPSVSTLFTGTVLKLKSALSLALKIGTTNLCIHVSY